MTSTDQIVRLDDARYAAAREALGRATLRLSADGLCDGRIRRRRARAVTFLLRRILWNSNRWGEIHITPDVQAVCCWLPPGRSTPPLREVAGHAAAAAGVWRTGFRRLMIYDDVARRLHHDFAPMPHYYLSSIGVQPERQGQGLGGALMQPMLGRADDEKVHCSARQRIAPRTSGCTSGTASRSCAAVEPPAIPCPSGACCGGRQGAGRRREAGDRRSTARGPIVANVRRRPACPRRIGGKTSRKRRKIGRSRPAADPELHPRGGGEAAVRADAAASVCSFSRYGVSPTSFDFRGAWRLW